MTTLREAAQQALEALEQDNPAGRSATITALRAALAQQEPVAKMHVVFEDNNGALRRTPADCQAFGANGQPAAVYVGRQRYAPEQERADPAQTPCDIAEDGVCEVLDCCRNSTQQEQEPVAWRYKPMIGSPWSLSDDGYYVSCKRDKSYIVEPLYAHPPRREWQSLSEEEIQSIHDTYHKRMGPQEFARAIEQTLKEKNNG
jgi:hypothetical protein